MQFALRQDVLENRCSICIRRRNCVVIFPMDTLGFVRKPKAGESALPVAVGGRD